MPDKPSTERTSQPPAQPAPRKGVDRSSEKQQSGQQGKIGGLPADSQSTERSTSNSSTE